MSPKEGPRSDHIDGELSVYGEVIEAICAAKDVGPGKVAVRAVDAQEGSTRREDITELGNLIDQGGFTLNDLHFLYSITTESAYKIVRDLAAEGNDLRQILYNFSACIEILFFSLPSIIDAAEARMRNEGIATPEALEKHKRIHDVYERHPDFVRKVIEAAFNDAPIRLAMESTLGYVSDVMDMTPASVDVSTNYGYDGDDDGDFDADEEGGTMLN